MSGNVLSRADAQLRMQEAVAAYRAGQVSRARQLARSIVDARPKFGPAHRLLGRIALDLHQPPLAATWFQRAVDAHPNDAAGWRGLGAARLLTGEPHAALKAYAESLRLEPDVPDAVTGRADALERLGDLDRCATALQPWLDSGRATAHMRMVMTRGWLGAGRLDDAIALAAPAVASTATPDGPRRAMALLLGRAYERNGAIDDAWAAYTLGNELLRQPFDRTAHARRIAEVGAAWAADAPPASSSSDADDAVLVFGLPRSGTTLLEQIIQAHPDAAAVGECHDLMQTAQLLARGVRRPWPSCAAHATTTQLGEAAAAYRRQLRSAAGPAQRIVDKSLENLELAGFARQLLPNARLIHVRRAPLDVAFAIWTENLDPALHPYAASFDDIACVCAAADTLSATWRAALGERYREIAYDDFVRDAEASIRDLIEFVGLPWHDDCLRFHESERVAGTLSNQQVRQPIHARSVGRAEAFGARLDPLRAALREAGVDGA